MELFLNLAWLLLALPAYWIWRRRPGMHLARVSSLQCLLALACVLVLLFPVISASDDLHAMRAEIEDSVTSKRAVRQGASDKSSAWVNRLQGTPAMAASPLRLFAPEVRLLQVFVVHLSPLAGSRAYYSGRAPPYSLLG